MTQGQALRMERRQMRAEREHEQALELVRSALAVLGIALILMAFGVAGRWDMEDESRELAYWESQGIHVVRDW